MQPPICEVCGRSFRYPGGGGQIEFSDYEPLPDLAVGQPAGLLWFCERHIEAARGLSGRTSIEALRALRSAGG